MSLLHKTNSVLNFYQPNDLFELTDRYQILKTDEYQSSNYISRKDISDLYNINFNYDDYNSENKNINVKTKELSENKNKKTNPIENNIPNLSFKKVNRTIKRKSSDDKNKSEIKKLKTKKLGYINEKYIKILEENKTLKEKLNIKEENSKEQLEKLKEENSKLKNDIEKLNKLNEEQGINLKEKNEIIENQKNEIENMNKKLSELTEQNKKLNDEINNLNIMIEKLSEDKNILINQISELNLSFANNIKPKLIKNENYLLSLEKQFNLLKKENDSLIKNDIKQKILIKTFKNKNKLKKQNSRKNTNLSNIIQQSNSLSIEDLTMNNSVYGSTSKKNKNFGKKSKKNSNSKSILKTSKTIKKLKNSKLKKSLSQNNIENESNSKRKIGNIFDLSSTNKKKPARKKESVKHYDAYNIYNKKKIRHISNNSTIIRINHNNNDLFGNKSMLHKFVTKSNKIINEENKQNELISTNIKKESNASYLSSYNVEKI